MPLKITVTINQRRPSLSFDRRVEMTPRSRSCALAGWVSNATGTCAIPLNFNLPGSTPQKNPKDWKYVYSFRSRHSGGANFLWVDGHANRLLPDQLLVEHFRRN